LCSFGKQKAELNPRCAGRITKFGAGHSWGNRKKKKKRERKKGKNSKRIRAKSRKAGI